MLLESNLASSLSILIGSFNTHKLYPPVDTDLSSWLTYKSYRPHIVAIGLQELPFTYSIFQRKSVDRWQELIEKTLPNYQLLTSVRLNRKTILSFSLIYHLLSRFNSFHLHSNLTYQPMFIHCQC